MILTDTKYDMGFWVGQKSTWGPDRFAGYTCTKPLDRELAKEYKYPIVSPDELSHWID